MAPGGGKQKRRAGSQGRSAARLSFFDSPCLEHPPYATAMAEALELSAMCDFLSTFDITSLAMPDSPPGGEVGSFGGVLQPHWTPEKQRHDAFGSDGEPLATTDTEGELGSPVESMENSFEGYFARDTEDDKRLRQRGYDKKARCKKKQQEENERHIFIQMINFACLELETREETTHRAQAMLATVHADMRGLQLAMQARAFDDSNAAWGGALRDQGCVLKAHLGTLEQQLAANQALMGCVEITIAEWDKARQRNKYFLRKKAPEIGPGMDRLAELLQKLKDVDASCRAWVEHMLF